MPANDSFAGSLERERESFARRQRSGVHFVAAATVAWLLIALVQVVVSDQMTRNLLTFTMACVVLPLAWLASKALHIPFQDESPLAKLGFLISMNQVLYLPIAMWVYAAAPTKLVMVLGVITAAHLLPFGWLYRSRAYLLAAIAGSLVAIVVGLVAGGMVTALTMAGILAALAIALLSSSRCCRPTWTPRRRRG